MLDKNAVDHDKVEAMRKLVDSPTSTVSGMEFNTFVNRIGSLNQGQLLTLQRKLVGLMPSAPAELGELNLERELVAQYTLVKDLQDAVLHDEAFPLNQRSQLAGNVASVLQQLIKAQSEFYTAERFRSIESALIAHMKRLPLELAEEFLAEYELLGETNGG